MPDIFDTKYKCKEHGIHIVYSYQRCDLGMNCGVCGKKMEVISEVEMGSDPLEDL